jgi:hypothetical protein
MIMATFTWKTNGFSGAWETAANWTPAGPPGAADDAKLTATGTYTVTTTATDTVNSVQTAAGATLVIGSATNFTMSSGTESTAFPTGANAGQISMSNNVTLFMGGTFNNTSTVAGGGLVMNGAANQAALRLTTATVTFTGGGKVVLGTAGNNVIYGNAAANTLVNVNNTFSGVGNIGDGQMALNNQTAGVINADNATGALTLQVTNGITNTGLLEASGAGGLFLLNDSIDNEGNSNAGKITAAVSGAHVDLQNTTIYGGTLTAVAGAQIDVVANQSGGLYGADPGAPVTIAAGTNFNVNNNSALYLYGSIVNNGLINLLGAANVASLRLVTPVTALSGGGQVVLGGTGNNQIYGNGGYIDELDNVDNTISGIGNIGANQMTLLNETAGVINANQAGQLTVQANGGMVNKGLMEATNASGNLFLLNQSVDNTQNSDSGKISATVSGAHVDLQNTIIYGGLLTSAAGAYFDVVSGQSGYLDGASSGAPINIAAGTTFNINNNSSLYLRGVIKNNGVINLGVDAGPNTTYIRLQSPMVTLTSNTPTVAGGVIQLSNATTNQIYGNDGATEVLNNINNTIQGSGNIGAGQMTLINGKLGIINANQPAGISGSGLPGQLIIQANGGVTNNGIMEATVPVGGTAGGDLFILNTVVNQTGGGKIEALGVTTNKIKYGATVDLQNSTIQGGTLISTASNPAKFEVVSGQSATFDGSVKILTSSAVVNVLNNSSLYLNGLISTKSGSINLQGAANVTYLRILNSTTLSGVGKINLGNSANNQIISNGGVQSLFNVDNTISGAGNIGAGGSLQLTNQTAGVINANQTAALVLQDAQTVSNYGTIESAATVAGAGGLLILNTNVDNTVANASNVLNTGKITATGTGHVDLQGSNIYGGTLTTTGTAVIDVVSGQSAGLNGTVRGQAVNIAAGSKVVVNDNSSLYLYGTINNAGTITVAGAANTTYIRLGSSLVSLSGGGNLVLSGGTSNDQIIQVGGNAELDNVNNTISGGGAIGAGGALYLKNLVGGTINATLAGGITINLGGVQMINSGILEATGSNLSVTNAVYNNGTIIAHGGNVTIGGNINGGGNQQLFGTSNIEIGSSIGAASAQTITFQTGSSGVFKIDQAQSFTGTVAGLATNGAVISTIDLGNLAIGTATLTYTGTTTSGVLTVTDGTIISTIKMTGNYTQANFHLANDGGGHTDVTYAGTGMAPSPAANSAVNQMVSAMASLGVGSSAAAMSSSAAHSAGGMLLALPHAA